MNQNRGCRVSLNLIIVAVFALLAAGVLTLVGNRKRQKAHANACIGNMRVIDGAKENVRHEEGLSDGSIVAREKIAVYFGRALTSEIICPATGQDTYEIGRIGEEPRCRYHGNILDAAKWQRMWP